MNKTKNKKKNQKEIINIANEFLKIPSVIENEKPFLKYLQEEIKNLNYETKLEENYLFIKGKNLKKKKKILFSIHIDRHGFIKNENNQLEYIAYFLKKKYNLKFNRDTKEFFENCALRHTKEKIFSYNQENKIIKKYEILRNDLDWKNKNIFFQTNKKISKEEKVFGIKSTIKIKDNLFWGQIDNVISAATIFKILKEKEFENDIIFTCKEEIGLSYISVINFLKKNKDIKYKIITLDTSPYENFNNKEEGFLVLRKGDENGNFDLELLEKIQKIIEEKKIPHYFKESNNGMTELGRISSESSGKYNGITIQIPSMNYHTSYETSTFESLENYYEIIKNIDD